MARKNFIKAALEAPGAKGGLHRSLDVPEGQTIPKSRIAAAAKEGGKVGQRARFAETLEGLHPKKKTVKKKAKTPVKASYTETSSSSPVFGSPEWRAKYAK